VAAQARRTEAAWALGRAWRRWTEVAKRRAAGGSLAAASWTKGALCPLASLFRPLARTLGMKTDGNRRENHFRSRILLRKIETGAEWERERKQDIRDVRVMETNGNRKIYRNALSLNHHSPHMNITLPECIVVKSPFTSHEYNTTYFFTCKLFSKNMIKVSYFL
jgi:hypothetical protein